MADEINSGGASSATEAPASAPDPGQAIKDAALGQMARSEDAEDYIKERQSRLAEERGETTPEVRDEDRADRIRKALTEAREETEKARQANGLDQKPNLDTAFEDAQAEWAAHQQEEQQFGQEREAARAEGKFQAVAFPGSLPRNTPNKVAVTLRHHHPSRPQRAELIPRPAALMPWQVKGREIIDKWAAAPEKHKEIASIAL